MIPFVKMQGTGNDFVVIDCRKQTYAKLDFKKIANRKTGIGCDQTILLYPSSVASCRMEIYNVDGSQAEMCGNAARCVLRLITDQQKTTASIELINRVVTGERVDGDRVKINMGKPRYRWDDIPLSQPLDTVTLPLHVGPLECPVATNIGNPHVTFFVEDVDRIDDFEKYAPQIENHELFPNRTNVSIASVVNDHEIKVRIWERGVGLTESCGSAACATLVGAIRKGCFRQSEGSIRLPGGVLFIEFDGEEVFMTGNVAVVFEGLYNCGDDD